MKVIVVASLTYSLLNFRRALLTEIIESGDHEVIACAPENDPEIIAELNAMGIRFEQVPMQRASTNPARDLQTLWRLHRLFQREKPDIVLAYTQKPIIYSGMAARLTRSVRFFAMQTGLGFTFGEQNKNDLLRTIVSFLYRIGIKKAETVIVFNSDDHEEMNKHGILQPNQPVVQVAGSGVDKERFPQASPPDGDLVFLLVARLMIDKGVYEFVEAARSIRASNPNVRFQILGPFDANPASISEADLAAWREEGVIDYLGETRDVRPYLAASSVFVLPSFHREGLPRSILEAMSTGRAIVTTHMPGCRETVIEGENGFLVPPQDASALAAAMQNFVDDPTLATRMGARSRQRVEETFDVRLVNDRLLKVMGLRASTSEERQSFLSADRYIVKATPLQRIIDVVAALAGSILFLPLIIIVYVAVALSMGRPALFKQMRGGRGGRAFQLVKFRTMTDERDSDGDLLSDEERTTPLGKFLRRSRLDELPELWNILLGEMSFVGPRPLLPQSPLNQGETGALRLSVRPGLTGWAQVNGNTLLSDDEKLALDLWYVKNSSLGLNFKIVLKTIGVVFGGEQVNKSELESAYEGDSGRSR